MKLSTKQKMPKRTMIYMAMKIICLILSLAVALPPIVYMIALMTVDKNELKTARQLLIKHNYDWKILENERAANSEDTCLRAAEHAAFCVYTVKSSGIKQPEKILYLVLMPIMITGWAGLNLLFKHEWSSVAVVMSFESYLVTNGLIL